MIRIALALTCIVLCVYFGAHSLGLIPDAEQVAADMRGKLCEEVALECGTRLQRGDDAGLRSYLFAFRSRRPEIVSLGLRNDEKALVFDSGDHARTWRERPAHQQTGVPLVIGGRTWGQLEAC